MNALETATETLRTQMRELYPEPVSGFTVGFTGYKEAANGSGPVGQLLAVDRSRAGYLYSMIHSNEGFDTSMSALLSKIAQFNAGHP